MKNTWHILLLVFVVGLLCANTPRGGAGVDRIGYGELSVTGGGAFVIDGANEWHAIIGLSDDEIAGDITTHTGTRVDLTGATFSTAGGGAQTLIDGVVHGTSVGDYVTITGSSDAAQNGVAQVVDVTDSDTFAVDIAFSSDPVTEGALTHGDHFEIENTGIYQVVVSMSATAVTGASTGVYGVYKNKTLEHQISRKYANATDSGASAITGLVSTTAGDEIWVGVLNSENGNNLTIADVSFAITRL